MLNAFSTVDWFLLESWCWVPSFQPRNNEVSLCSCAVALCGPPRSAVAWQNPAGQDNRNGIWVRMLKDVCCALEQQWLREADSLELRRFSFFLQFFLSYESFPYGMLAITGIYIFFSGGTKHDQCRWDPQWYFQQTSFTPEIYRYIYTQRLYLYIYNEHTENVNRKYTVYRFKNMYVYVYFRNFSFAQSRT